MDTNNSVTQNKIDALQTLAREALACQKCNLCNTRTKLVFGEGSPDAKFMIIGEAPGEAEDNMGRPFVGAAGRLLDGLLESIGLIRADIFITNILKCRPPFNRNPAPIEEVSCVPFLDRQIAIIQPKVIITLGNYATKYMLDTDVGISKLHGNFYQNKNGRLIYPVYHPAAALYHPKLRLDLKIDFRKLKGILAQP